MTDRSPWPDPPPAPPAARLTARVRAAGGAARVLPGYLAARPWRRGLLLSEYLALGLARRPAAEARDHLGALGAARLALTINRVSNRRGLVADKMLFDAMLRGAGLSAPRLRAVFGRPAPVGVERITDADSLGALLSAPGVLPLFGKPAQGQRSTDALAIAGYDGESRSAITAAGQRVPLDRIVAHLSACHAGGGYLFQDYIRQHPDVGATVGPAVATLRLITLFRRGKVHLLGAVWKIPRAGAQADNTWRGNLVAPVDPATGRVGPACEGRAWGAATIVRHPDTGAAIEGFVIPGWTRIVQRTRRAAGLLSALPLIGWDVAIGPDGPVFVEANSSPSLEAWQIPLGRGALAGEGGALLRTALTESVAARKSRRAALRLARRRLILSRLRPGA